MLKLEFKRSIHNKSLFYIIIVNIICFGLGIILPIGLDHVKHLSMEEYIFSIYTVYCQFGMMLFSFVVAYMLNNDYINKNMVFYFEYKVNLITHMLYKGIVFFVENIMILLVLFGLSILYFGMSKLFLILLFLTILVLFQHYLVVNIVSIFTKNILSVVGISFFLWLGSIVMISFGGILKYLNVFDASNVNYDLFDKLLINKINYLPDHFWYSIIIEFLVLISIFVMCLLIRTNKIKRNIFN